MTTDFDSRTGDEAARAAGVRVRPVAGHIGAEIDGVDLSGSWWMADYWRRSGIAQRWQLADRQLARIDDGSPLPDAVRGLQLWR